MQQSFSYVGTGLSGLNQYYAKGLMCLAQWHDAVTPVRLETVALWSRVRSVWIQNAVKANALEPGLAGDQIGPGTGPDFLAKHTAATHPLGGNYFGYHQNTSLNTDQTVYTQTLKEITP